MTSMPTVSICCITYNHEKYIRNAIQGFLIQKTTFAFEILIFDDASSDNTQKIISEYASKNENIITFLQKENQWSKGKYGLLDWLFPAAKGKYIALCEGDDYWIDPLKLQKQVDLLEKDSSLAGASHGCTIKYESGRKDRKFIYKKTDCIDPSLFLCKNIFTTTGSFMFRIDVLEKLPAFSNELFSGDTLLKYLILSCGDIGYIPENMSVYRKGTNGSWSNRKVTKKVVNKEFSDDLRILYYFDDITEYKFHNAVQFATKKMSAFYILHNIPFNTFWKNTKNFFLAFPYLPFRVLSAYLLNVLKSMYQRQIK